MTWTHDLRQLSLSILTVSIPVTVPAGFSTLLQFTAGVPEKHLEPV